MLAVGGGLVTVRRRASRQSPAAGHRQGRDDGTPDADSLSRADSAPTRRADQGTHVG